MSNIVLAVVGTAGRTSKPSKGLFDWMVSQATSHIGSLIAGKGGRLELVSGGAAYGDHVAEVLHRALGQMVVTRFRVHIPARGTRAREIMGHYHKSFTEVMGLAPGTTMAQALEERPGKEITFYEGPKYQPFFDRNAVVAGQATHMLAFTYDAPGDPLTGGTGDTWRTFVQKCGDEGWPVEERMKHVSLLGVE